MSNIDDSMVGFTFVERIVYGADAYLHMYLMPPQLRKSGYGPNVIQPSIKTLFDQLTFDDLYSQPLTINTQTQLSL